MKHIVRLGRCYNRFSITQMATYCYLLSGKRMCLASKNIDNYVKKFNHYFHCELSHKKVGEDLYEISLNKK